METEAKIRFNLDEDSYEDVLGKMMELQFIAHDIAGKTTNAMWRVFLTIMSFYILGLVTGLLFYAVILK